MQFNAKIALSRSHTHTRLTALFPGLPGWGVNRYQTGKTNLDFTKARDSEWQWHQLGYMQVCISLQPEDHASTPPLSFLQAGCPTCRPTNSVKALKALVTISFYLLKIIWHHSQNSVGKSTQINWATLVMIPVITTGSILLVIRGRQIFVCIGPPEC